jgi:hypothetical protein
LFVSDGLENFLEEERQEEGSLEGEVMRALKEENNGRYGEFWGCLVA